MDDPIERQPAIGTDVTPRRLPDGKRQRVQHLAQHGGDIIVGQRGLADSDKVAFVLFDGLFVGGQFGQPAVLRADEFRQVTHLLAGGVLLLVEMAFLEQ